MAFRAAIARTIPLGSTIPHNTLCEMATNLDVDTAVLDELVRLGGFRSKREAVDAAVREAIAWRQQVKALEALGAIEFIATAPRTEGAGG